MELKLEEAVKAVKGTLKNSAAGMLIKGVSTDSRKVSEGDLFFALKGPNFDGHTFVKDVAQKGAAGAVIEQGFSMPDLPASFRLIVVEDTLKALGALAAYHRSRFEIPVLAITGSAGKTTTKEMASSIISRSRKVLKTQGNLNNLIGLPLTLFRLDDTHGAAVVELGISESWEMERLVRICEPDIALITNIGRGHLKTLGSVEGVAKAKGPLFTAIAQDKARIVNLDDEWAVKLASTGKGNITFSQYDSRADVFVEGYIGSGLGSMEVTYNVRGKRIEVNLNSPGECNVINGAAAIAAALPFNASVQDMQEGLSSFSAARGRMEVICVNGLTVLDDTYNANPESMSAALKTLKKAFGGKVAVLGDMLELGELSIEAHREVGRLAALSGARFLMAVGGYSDEMLKGALLAGMDAKYMQAFNSKAEALEALKSILQPGDSVLVKGSRAVGLEYIVEGLKTPAGR